MEGAPAIKHIILRFYCKYCWKIKIYELPSGNTILNFTNDANKLHSKECTNSDLTYAGILTDTEIRKMLK